MVVCVRPWLVQVCLVVGEMMSSRLVQSKVASGIVDRAAHGIVVYLVHVQVAVAL